MAETPRPRRSSTGLSGTAGKPKHATRAARRRIAATPRPSSTGTSPGTSPPTCAPKEPRSCSPGQQYGGGRASPSEQPSVMRPAATRRSPSTPTAGHPAGGIAILEPVADGINNAIVGPSAALGSDLGPRSHRGPASPSARTTELAGSSPATTWPGSIVPPSPRCSSNAPTCATPPTPRWSPPAAGRQRPPGRSRRDWPPSSARADIPQASAPASRRRSHHPPRPV